MLNGWLIVLEEINQLVPAGLVEFGMNEKSLLQFRYFMCNGRVSSVTVNNQKIKKTHPL